MSLKEQVEKKQAELDKKQAQRKGVPLGYSSYFSGYTTYRVKKKNGKGTKLLRIYTDPYMEHDMTDGEWRRRKLIFAWLALIAAALFVFAALSGSKSGLWAVVAVLGSLSLMGMVFVVTYVIRYIAAPRRMTRWTQSHNHKGILISALPTWVLLALCGVADVIYAVFLSDGGVLIELVTALGYLASGCAIFAIWQLERKTDYFETENDPDIPDFTEIIL